MTVEEAEHQIATRLYQNTAKVHFDALAQQGSRFGKRLIYGGVAISLARALAFNGLANAQLILAINAGRHVNPLFAGDTLYAWSEVLAKDDLGDAGALRLRLVALKNKPARRLPAQERRRRIRCRRRARLRLLGGDPEALARSGERAPAGARSQADQRPYWYSISSAARARIVAISLASSESL